MARIVIVDDSRTERDYLRGLLQRAGHQVVGQAASGESGIEVCAKECPDVALLDVAMRGMHGDVAARKVREAGTAAHIIIVSSNVGFIGEQYRSEGFACINKPHTGPKILQLIEEVTRGESHAGSGGASQ